MPGQGLLSGAVQWREGGICEAAGAALVAADEGAWLRAFERCADTAMAG
jgi:hypothetical protein